MLCCCLILGPQHGVGGRALISPLSPPSRGVGAVYKSTLSREPEVLQMLGCLWDGSCSTGWESCCHRNAPGQEWDFFAPWRNPSAENGSGRALKPPPPLLWVLCAMQVHGKRTTRRDSVQGWGQNQPVMGRHRAGLDGQVGYGGGGEICGCPTSLQPWRMRCRCCCEAEGLPRAFPLGN